VAELRKPDAVLWIRPTGERRATKVEFFKAGKFVRFDRFTDKRGIAIPTNNVDHYFRLRVDGIWFPAGQRVFYTKNQCVVLVKKEIFK
jgi:hypothetical protein